ncbi:MAG: hypothetical protein ACR2NA_03570 [Solirubrobacterales bacterium]
MPQLRNAGHKLGAIDEYLSRTSTEGRARAAAAMRRLEARIGELIPPPAPGRRTDLQPVERDREVALGKDERSDFRRMAENPDIVEEVIANSTDKAPASRRKVTEAIRTPKPEKPRRSPLPDFARKAAWTFRKSAERLEHVVEDDRFAANKEKVAAHLRGDLLYAVEACQDLLRRLGEEP